VDFCSSGKDKSVSQALDFMLVHFNTASKKGGLGPPEEKNRAGLKPGLYKRNRNYGWESGRRLSVGRSSSVLLGSVLVGCSWIARFRAPRRLAGGVYRHLAREHDVTQRLFTESNSEVVTMYSCLRAGCDAISFCEFFDALRRRDGWRRTLGGWCRDGAFIGLDALEEGDVGVGSYPALYIY